MTKETMRTGLLALLLSAALPAALQAHEGHGLEMSWAGLGHWLSSPVHLVSAVALVAVVVGLVGAASLLRWSGRPRDAEAAPARPADGGSSERRP